MLKPGEFASAVDTHVDVVLETARRIASGDGAAATGVLAIHLLGIMSNGGDLDEALGELVGIYMLAAGSMMTTYVAKSGVELDELTAKLRDGMIAAARAVDS